MFGRMLYQANEKDNWQISPLVLSESKNIIDTIKMLMKILFGTQCFDFHQGLYNTLDLIESGNAFMYEYVVQKNEHLVLSLTSSEPFKTQNQFMVSFLANCKNHGLYYCSEPHKFMKHTTALLLNRFVIIELNSHLDISVVESGLNQELSLLIQKCNLAYIETIHLAQYMHCFEFVPKCFLERMPMYQLFLLDKKQKKELMDMNNFIDLNILTVL
jgi:hypothetical protein